MYTIKIILNILNNFRILIKNILNKDINLLKKVLKSLYKNIKWFKEISSKILKINWKINLFYFISMLMESIKNIW